MDLYFIVTKYYFSESYKKKFYRSVSAQDNKIIFYSKSLKTLESNTINIIEYLDETADKNIKKYNFWKLLYDNEK